MFDKPGSQLKTYASTLFGITTALICILAFWVAFSMRGLGAMIWLVCLIVAALLIFIAYVLSLFVYAFGEMVENSEKLFDIEEQVKAISSDIKKSRTEITPTKAEKESRLQVNSVQIATSEQIDNTTTPKTKKETASEPVAISKDWICPKCGRKRAHYYESCPCGYVK